MTQSMSEYFKDKKIAGYMNQLKNMGLNDTECKERALRFLTQLFEYRDGDTITEDFIQEYQLFINTLRTDLN